MLDPEKRGPVVTGTKALAKKKNDTLHPGIKLPPRRVKFTTETPLNYPSELGLPTLSAISEATKMDPFDVQGFAKTVLKELTPAFLKMVKEGRLRAEQAPKKMVNMLGLLLKMNASDLHRPEQEVLRSSEWHNFIRQLAGLGNDTKDIIPEEK